MHTQIIFVALLAVFAAVMWAMSRKRTQQAQFTLEPLPWWARWRPRWSQLAVCLTAMCVLLIMQNGGHGASLDGGVMLLVFGTLTDEEFQKKVLEGADELKNRVEKGFKQSSEEIEEIGEETKAVASKAERLLSDISRLDTTSKGLLEDITKLKNVANDSQANHNAFVQKLKMFESQLRNEMRGAYGDPARRIADDDDLRTRLNARVAKAILKPGQDLPEFHVKALGEDTSPGSTMIDDRLDREIYDTLSRYGVWNQFAVRRLGTKTTKFLVKTVRPVANFILTEAGTISDDSNKAGTSTSKDVELIAVLLNVSNQLLDDSEFDVTADVLDDFAQAVAFRLDVAALTADGTADATNGGMTGIFQGGTLVAAAATEDTVEELDLEDFQACLLAVDPIVLERPAKWWMHPYVLARTLAIKDSTGRPLFQTAMEAPSFGAMGSILGFPVSLAHAAPSANTANTRVATFGDPNGEVVGIRKDFTFESSDHHRWATNERSFRGTARALGLVRKSTAFANLRLTT